MLAYLLDENISYVIAEQLVYKNPQMSVRGIYRWQGGAFVGQDDARILRAAAQAKLTLATCDLKTIPTLLGEMAADGETHGGVLFVDQATMCSSDFWRLVNALLAHWERYSAEEWSNRIGFLERV